MECALEIIEPLKTKHSCGFPYQSIYAPRPNILDFLLILFNACAKSPTPPTSAWSPTKATPPTPLVPHGPPPPLHPQWSYRGLQYLWWFPAAAATPHPHLPFLKVVKTISTCYCFLEVISLCSFIFFYIHSKGRRQ